jgi:hypothetical protein
VARTHGVTVTPGTRFMMNSAATFAFGWPTSLGLVKDSGIRGAECGVR